MYVCMYAIMTVINLHTRANMTEVDSHARDDINNDIMVDMLNN